MNKELEVFITKEIAKIINENDLNVLAYNICEDHVHILLVCEPDELPNIVRKLKEYLGVPKEEKFHLWAQKFDLKPVEDEKGLEAVRNYIIRNREKHNLPPNKGLQPLGGNGDNGGNDINNGSHNNGLQPIVARGRDSGGGERGEFGYFGMCCTIDHAFRPEYTGGFDVVIGNPPYVVYIKSVFGERVVDYVNEKYNYAEYNPNTYALFTDLGLNKILKNKGRIGFIIPNSWLEGKYFSQMRNSLYSMNVDEIVYLKDTVFD